jgi:DNA (cytosine-5)-methyltransferase 1
MYEQLSLMTYQPPTSGASASRAKTLASQASKKACKKVSEADCFTKLCDCLPAVGKKIDPDGYSLKMLKIYLALETDLTSRGCCLKWGGYGYSLQWDTLNSKDYGVPQNRERVFIVCYLGNISGQEVFPLRRTDGENPCELKEITQGVADAQRIYESDGLARTLKGESGGQGGKTGLYAVKVLKPYGSTGGVCGLKITENETGIASPCVARDYKGIKGVITWLKI